MATLRQKAEYLSETLHQMIKNLEAYDDERFIDYAHDAARRLKPYAENFDKAVFTNRSKEQAAMVLSDMKGLMESISAASSKGEMNFSRENIKHSYWDLETMFRESQHKDEEL